MVKEKLKYQNKVRIAMLVVMIIVANLIGGNLGLKSIFCYAQIKKGEQISKQTKEAYKVLSKAKQIQGAYLTMVLLPSPHVAAFRCILKDPNRDKVFKKLFEEKNTVSKLYALGGLYYTDRSQFEILIQQFKSFGYTLESITSENGCVSGHFTVAEFVESLENGYWPQIWRGDISF